MYIELTRKRVDMQYFKIADLKIFVDGADYEVFKNRLRKYSVAPFVNPDIKINFILDNNINEVLPDFFTVDEGRYYFETDCGVGFYDYIDEVDKIVTIMNADCNWTDINYRFSDLSEIFGVKTDTAVGNVVGNLFQQSIMNFDGIVIHASTIKYNGKAVTFTAPSGTGKSTHTGLWKKYYPETVIINDDMPAIRFIDNQVFAYGTPWSGKTDINENDCAPLDAMVFIERSEECSITELSPVEAFVRMMREIPIYPFKHQSDLMMSMMNKLFTKVPSYLLKCDISKNAVDTVKNKLFK